MEVREYTKFDATGLKELIDKGEVTADEVREAAVAAIEEVQPGLNALVGPVLDPPVAGSPDGPFAGIPFLIKDLVCSAEGVAQESGSRLFAGYVPDHDSTLMTRFKRAGLTTIGRTATPELGFNANTAPIVNGPTRNPWNVDHIPGGSSGGSAALVAARAVPMAHANDGGGSIRIPAACTGLVGLKPTRGRVPLGPDVDEALNGMAVEFAVTRTVRDTARLLDAVAGPSIGDKYTVRNPDRAYSEEVGADPGRLRVALSKTSPWGRPVDHEVAAVVDDVGRRLESAGHTVDEAAPPLDVDAFLAANVTIWSWFNAVFAYGFAAAIGRQPGPDNLETATWACVEHGSRVTGMELAQAFAVQNAVTRGFGAFLDRYDLYVSPVLPVPPLPVGSLDQNGAEFTTAASWCEHVFTEIPFTPQFNLTGQPSMSLPLGMSSGGLPIGVMVSAASLREDLLIRVAAQLEDELPWADRRPSVCAGASSGVGP
jgi:amidase